MAGRAGGRGRPRRKRGPQGGRPLRQPSPAQAVVRRGRKGKRKGNKYPGAGAAHAANAAAVRGGGGGAAGAPRAHRASPTAPHHSRRPGHRRRWYMGTRSGHPGRGHLHSRARTRTRARCDWGSRPARAPKELQGWVQLSGRWGPGKGGAGAQRGCVIAEGPRGRPPLPCPAFGRGRARSALSLASRRGRPGLAGLLRPSARWHPKVWARPAAKEAGGPFCQSRAPPAA